MLVCAVALKPGEVIQHRDAQVCFDARCVIPLLEVYGRSFRSQPSRTSGLARPTPAKPRELFGLTLEQFGCPAADLLLAGYAVPLCQMGFKLEDLLVIGASPEHLLKAGYQAKSLLEAFTLAELQKGGYPARELKEAGFSAFDLHNAGYTAAQLEEAFPAMVVNFMDQVGTDGFPVRRHLNGAAMAGYPAVRLRQIGCRAAELRAAGYDWAELFQADFDTDELLDAGADFCHFQRWRPDVVCLGLWVNWVKQRCVDLLLLALLQLCMLMRGFFWFLFEAPRP